MKNFPAYSFCSSTSAALSSIDAVESPAVDRDDLDEPKTLDLHKQNNKKKMTQFSRHFKKLITVKPIYTFLCS
jgi:hypothetical protein